MPARLQGLKLALGSAKQTNISTIGTTYNTFLKLDASVPFLNAHTENDAAEIGKGNEWISHVFKTNKEPQPLRMEKYGSAEWMLWSWGYACGDVALATGLYTIHPLDPGTSLENPYFTVAAQLAEGGGFSLDEAYVGCSVESVETVFRYGPGRDSIRTTTEIIGSGVSVLPSGVTYPATLSENYARSSGMTISINGIDYVAGTPGAKTALAGTIGFRNNYILPMRYFPGSGYDTDGFAVGGRTLIGVRQHTFTFTAFLDHDSTEYAKLVAQTVGTASIKMSFDSTHYIQWDWSTASFEVVERVQEEGIVAVTVTIAPRYDATLGTDGKPKGVVTVTGKCSVSDIAQ